MTRNSTRQIVFIDSNVTHAATLLAGIDPSFQVVWLTADQPALQQIASALQGQTGVDAIHLISHGSAGSLSLSSGTLTTASLAEPANASALQTIQAALSEQADWLIYGCDVAAGDVGQAFVSALAQATGADVAASTNATGAAVLGGDWVLEAATGEVQAAPLAAPDYASTLAAASITGLTTISATENAGPVNFGGALNLSGASGGYAGRAMTLSIRDASAGDKLSFVNSGDPVTNPGVITLSGNALHLGTGSGTTVLGSLVGNDTATLQLNFASLLLTFDGANGTQGYTTSTAALDHTGNLGQQTHYITRQEMAFDYAMRITTSASGVVHPPRVWPPSLGSTDNVTVHGGSVTSNTFAANAGDAIKFDWQVSGGFGNLDVYAELTNTDTGAVSRIFSYTGAASVTLSNLATASSTIPATGNYQLKFVGGGSGGIVANDFYVNSIRVHSSITESLVNSIVDHLAYSANDNAYTSTSRVLDIAVTTDAPGFPYVFTESASASANIAITPVNDAPTLTDASAAGYYSAVQYVENGAAQRLFNRLLVTDPDSPASLAGGHITLHTTDGNSADQLSVLATTLDSEGTNYTFAVSGSTVTANGVHIASIDAVANGQNGADLKLNLTGNASLAYTQALARALGYASTSETLTVGGETRHFALTVNDGGQTGSGSALQASINHSLLLQGVNDTPVLTLQASSYSANITGGAWRTLNSNLTTADIDAGTESQAIVWFSTGYQKGSDFMRMGGSNSYAGSQGSISASFDANSGKLTLSGTGTAADYQNALRLVEYSNNAGNTSARAISYVVGSAAGITFPSETPATTEYRMTSGVGPNPDSGYNLLTFDAASIGVPASTTGTSFDQGFVSGTSAAIYITYALVAANLPAGFTGGYVRVNGEIIRSASVSYNQYVSPYQSGTDYPNINYGFNGYTYVYVDPPSGGSANIAFQNSNFRDYSTHNALYLNYPHIEYRTTPGSFNSVTPTSGDLVKTIGLSTYNTASNVAPTADPQTVTVLEDAAARVITLTGADADGDAVSFVIDTLPSGGTLYQVASNGTLGAAIGAGGTTLSNGGNVAFVPTANANGNGAGNFSFHTSAGGLSSGSTGVTVNVTAVNDYPSFTLGANPAAVLEDAGAQTVAGFASALSKGPADEAGQTGSYTVTTSNNAAFAVLPSIDANGDLSYTAAAHFNGEVVISVTYTDNGGTANGGIATSSTQSATLTLTAVNDAPVGVASSVTSAEDAVVALRGSDFGFTDPLDAGVTVNTLQAVLITTLPGTGTLKFDGADLSAGTTVTVADLGMGRLTYTPASNVSGNGAASFTFQVQDNGGTANGGVNLDATPRTLTINLTPSNDAPVLVDGVPTLSTITEEATTNNGNLISDLVGGTSGGTVAGNKSGITDVDTLNNGGAGYTGEFVGQGVAIYNTANNGPADGGTWEYSLNNGSSWTAIGSVNESTALLLRAIDKVRFVPDQKNATTATLGYYLWDGATGTQGNTADVSQLNRGGATAFSTVGDTASITVTPVNDAPVLDLDANNSSTATGDSTGGGFSYTGNFLIRGTGVAVLDADIRITDVDNSGSTGATTPDTLASATVAISGGAIDNNFGTINETLTASGGNATAGGFTVSGSGTPSISITGTGTWAQYETLLKTITYQNANTNAFHGVRTVSVTVNDSAAPGGTAGSAVATASIDNIWAPVVDTNGTAAGVALTSTYTEGNPALAIASFDSTITDEDSHLGSVVVSISNVQNAGLETLTVTGGNGVNWNGITGLTVVGSGTSTVTISGNIAPSSYQLALRSIKYANSSNNPSEVQRDVTVVATDIDGHVGNTGHSYIGVLAVNSAPVLGAAAGITLATVAEDVASASNPGSLVSDLVANGRVTDQDLNPAAAPEAIAIAAVDNTHGAWQYQIGAGAWTPISLTGSNTGKALLLDATDSVRFVPAAHWNGTVTNGITFHAWDKGTGAAGSYLAVSGNTGGTKTLSVATDNSTSMVVTAVPDAPALGAVTVAVAEDSTASFSVASFTSAFSDPDVGDTLQSVTITTLPSSGLLKLSGATVTQGQTIPAANLGNLSYVPAANENGVRNFTLTASDGSLSTASTTASITLSPVNDLPGGRVTIGGVPTQGQTLSATHTLTDVDGLGTISYQWRAAGVDLAGATGSTLVLGQAHVGKAISVIARYTDAQASVEAVSSDPTTTVANVNDLPTGAVNISGTIAGTPTQGGTLTATNTLFDLDGLGAIHYQWQADGVDISGGTNGTLVLTQAEVGKAIAVKARYTDSLGSDESMNSATTTAVLNVNEAPNGGVMISGITAQGQTLTVNHTLTDLDGLPSDEAISYQWSADGVAINSATGSTLFLGQDEVGKVITVKANYIDLQGGAEGMASGATVAVVNVNDGPTGIVSIGGSPVQGQTLTAANTVADADGPNLLSIRYQWQANGMNISGATGATLTQGQDQVGKTITVLARYTDAFGFEESLSSTATASVANVNDAPSGAVAISGTPAQGQTLSATHTLTDVDGLGTISYQWRAAGVDLAGATGSTLVLGQAHVGKAISVIARYTDAQASVESVGSSGTSAVANVNDAPTGGVTIAGTATQGMTLTAANTLADVDGPTYLAVSYQWQANGVDITGATAETFVPGQGQVGKTIAVKASYTDAFGAVESKTSSATAAVLNVNEPPSGGVTIAGTPTQGQTLTAANTLADTDGPTPLTVSYQWQANGVDIAGATAETFVPGQSQVGKTISVVARYTDAFGSQESMTSGATASVVNVNDAPSGAVVISGTPIQGRALTVVNTLADDDGPSPLTVSYQWQANGVDIAGATASTFVPGQSQVGKSITLVAHYTDAFGATESKTSSATTAVANVNDAPSGGVTITGSSEQGQTLTAANTLADGDGPTPLTVSYQWQANGVDITGATGATFTPGQAQVGKAITVKASYTDALGAGESKTSSATTAVANVNEAPSGGVTITGSAAQGQTLTAANTLADTDGPTPLTVSYQWQANGVDINGATTSTFVPGQSQVGKTIAVVARYTDAFGATESKTSSVTTEVVNANDAPSGSVTISGTPTEGQTLTAVNTLADTDGPTPLTVSYQWQANGVDIGGATASTFVPGQSQVGKSITLVARYTDAFGATESKTSGATAAVVNVNDAPSGGVAISGTPTQGQTLTAANTLADGDGPTPLTVSYQWQANGVNITGATGSTYAPGQDLVGKTITVVARYTDAMGKVETMTSTATALVVNANDAPAGGVAITGTPVQSHALTAVNTLTDSDGPTPLVVSYQWQANGVDIGGATGATFAPGQEQVGKSITVVARYTDSFGTATEVASSATTAIANLNDVPVIVSAAVKLVAENTTAVTNVVATDLDGDTLTYAMAGGDDQGKFTVNAATGALAFASAPNFDVPADSNRDNVYLVSVSASDGKGGVTQKNLSVLVTDVLIEAALSFSTLTFVEVATNDGSITTTSTITLVDDTFAGAVGGALGGVAHVPLGLTASLVKASATTATLSLSGQAVNHANANDVGNLTVTFGNADFAGGWAAAVTGATAGNLMIDFVDPVNTDPANTDPVIAGVPDAVQRVAPGIAAALPDFTVADAEQGETHLVVTLTATNGTLDGLIDTDDATDGIQITGTAASINTALAQATFTAAGSGAATIGISVSDGVGPAAVVAHYDLVSTSLKDSDFDQFPDSLEKANGLTVGVKDNDVFTSAKFFAMQLYRDVLLREGEADGVQLWQGLIESGQMSRAEVALAFQNTPEFHAGVGGIERLYFGALGRMPEVSFIADALALEHAGTSLTQLAQTVAASTEFAQLYGQLSNAGYVDALYQHVVQRAAEPGAANYWVTQLDSGMNRSEVLLGFTESAEYRQAIPTDISIALDYVNLLGRSPDPAGFDYWVNQQNLPLPEVTIVGAIIASAEFHDRFLP